MALELTYKIRWKFPSRLLPFEETVPSNKKHRPPDAHRNYMAYQGTAMQNILCAIWLRDYSTLLYLIAIN